MSQRRCMGCMALTEKPVCEHCGSPAEVCNEPHQLPVGTLLRGQYQVGRVLGQGGFGITYLGWDTYLDTPVAIKEYYPNSLVNRESTQSLSVHCYTETVAPAYTASMERFLREAKALAKFDDEPAIVRIKSFFPENGTAYIVMEYVRGTALHKYVAMRGGRLSLEETLRILKPVMEALDTVHKTGMIHRDISPDNIILHPKGGAKLLDFGAVRSVENPDADKVLTQSTEAILKHGFAPMEQYQNKGSLGPWTDVYALCATIYYCVTGRVPEDAPARMMEERDPDWSTVPGITAYQKQALEKGMALRTGRRTASVGELMGGLYPADQEDYYGRGEENAAAAEAAQEEQRRKEQQLREEKLRKEKLKEEKLREAASRSKPKPEEEKSQIPEKKPEEMSIPQRSLLEDDRVYAPVSERSASKKPKRIQKTLIVLCVLSLLAICLLLPKHGWYEENGQYSYYLWPNRQLTSSWMKEDDHYYYFGSDGIMYTGRHTINGNTYYFGNDGVMRTGWHKIGNSYYYFGNDGVMRTGWQIVNGDRYYFGNSGIMRTGWQKIAGSYYYFDDYGRFIP